MSFGVLSASLVLEKARPLFWRLRLFVFAGILLRVESRVLWILWNTFYSRTSPTTPKEGHWQSNTALSERTERLLCNWSKSTETSANLVLLMLAYFLLAWYHFFFERRTRQLCLFNLLLLLHAEESLFKPTVGSPLTFPLTKLERSEASLQFNLAKIERSEASLQSYSVKRERSEDMVK